MHSSVAMIILLTTSLMVTSWHDCWFQVARSVQSGDHFLQADFIGTDGDTRPYQNDINLNPHLPRRTDLSRADTSGESSLRDLYIEGHGVGPADVLDDELVLPVVRRPDLNRTLRSGRVVLS